jgi:hypothetical protein
MTSSETEDDSIGIIDPSHWQPTPKDLAWMEANDLLTTQLDKGDELVFHFKCIRSGGCCRTNLCELGSYGESTDKVCIHLSVASELSDGSNLYECTVATDSSNKARQIGKGCCAPWTPQRNRLLENYRNNNTDLIAKLKII